MERKKILDDTEVVNLRVPTAVAAAINANPASAQLALELGARSLDTSEADALVVDPEAFVGYSDWYKDGLPDCSGYWDVVMSPDSFLHRAKHRLWYDTATKSWRTGPAASRIMMPPQYHWRGLKAPAIGGYTYRVRDQRVRIKE